MICVCITLTISGIYSANLSKIGLKLLLLIMGMYDDYTQMTTHFSFRNESGNYAHESGNVVKHFAWPLLGYGVKP